MFKNSCSLANQDKYPFILPDLPYQHNALEPYISAKTFEFHHGKHHLTYVNNLNKIIENDSEKKLLSLEELIIKSVNNPEMVGIFNNSAQVWNHSFFWHSMAQNGGGKPDLPIIQAIEKEFGSFEKFLEEFKATGLSQFGSGWVWLVKEQNKLKIVKTSNAHTPLTDGNICIICCDVWEHAYYIDYQNKRADFIDVFLNKLVNWEFANNNFIGN